MFCDVEYDVFNAVSMFRRQIEYVGALHALSENVGAICVVEFW